MSLRYRIMYAVGFVPWDNERVPAELRTLVEGPHALEPDRALDIGCGTGTQAVHLARLGWEVTALDAVAKPLEQARARGERAGVEVEWIQDDVARLADHFPDPRFALIHDRGCFHDLPEATRAAYARGVTAAARPGATLLMLAFVPNRRPGPAGADEREIRSRFGEGWRLVSATADSGPAPSGPARNVPRVWYRLERAG